MEVFFGLTLVGLVGVLFACVVFEAKDKQANFLNKKEEKKEDFSEYNQNYRAEVAARLTKKVEEDTERYIVEVTTKDGTVYKTKEFIPNFYVDYNYSNGKIVAAREIYTNSKQSAEQFVFSCSHQNLVRLGDDFICPKSVSKVKLVKVK